MQEKLAFAHKKPNLGGRFTLTGIAKGSMLLALYRLMMQASTPLLGAYLQKRLRAGKEDPLRTHERRGRPQKPRPQGRLVWFHAASVGESLSLLALIHRVRRDYPDAAVMVTTGTVTSAALMAERLPEGAFHQYIPVDHPSWVKGFVDHWQPDVVIWAESDLWPNMLGALRARKIPAILLNARMSQSSYERWRYARGTAAQILGAFHLCLAQNAAEADRLRALGAANVKISANLKYAAAPLPVDVTALENLRAQVMGRPLLLWASTHPGEETRAIELHKRLVEKFPRLLSVIVPRHAARGGEIAAQITEAGVPVARRSLGDGVAEQTGIYLADTMGELGLFYRLCPFVVMGGTFADIGGHNPIEPGQCGCTVFWGPVGYNFITVLEDFRSAQAIVEVAQEEELFTRVSDALAAPDTWRAYGDNAARMTGDKANVLDGIMADIAPIADAALRAPVQEAS